MSAREHVAGPYVNHLQRCTRCGAVLADNRRAAWPESSEPPSGFRPGARIVVLEGQPRVVGSASLFAQAPLCGVVH